MTHTYRISNRTSGSTLGDYPGETPEDAVRAMHRDAGYDSDEHVLHVLGVSYEHMMDDLIVQRIDEEDTDGTHEYELREDGYHYYTVEASSVEEALEIAESNVDRDNYGDCAGTLHVSVRASCDETGEDEIRTVSLHPDEPDCVDGRAHEWCSPHELLGGLKENPGVQGHGGGVIIREVCCHCGTYQITDTWAQDTSTGEQGLTSIYYEDADDGSIEWVEQRQSNIPT